MVACHRRLGNNILSKEYVIYMLHVDITIWNNFPCFYTALNVRLDWNVCLTQLFGGIDMYYLLHRNQLHVSALFIGHLQVGKLKT